MSSFTPTPAEQALVSQIFAQNDTQGRGVITGETAIRVFNGAKLNGQLLAQIWAIADEDESGQLARRGVSIALRLIGWAQKGETVSRQLINKPGPLAVLEGYNTVARHGTGASAPKSPPPLAFPPLTPQDRTKYQGLFQRTRPEDGLLSGEKARVVFVKSKLSTDQLLQIWNLADTKSRGYLDQTDFIIAMYFIEGLMQKRLSFIPTSLPPGLYQQASGGAFQSASSFGGLASQPTGTSGSFSPSLSSFSQNRPLQQQYTGQSQSLQPDYTGLSATQGRGPPPRLPSRPNVVAAGSAAFGNLNGAAQPPWDVSAADKAAYDQHFETLDTHKQGYIEGDIAVPFMVQSNLDGEDLARIWDLADLSGDGRLTRDGFAVAMHLMNQRIAHKPIPAVLPPSLIPPSMRQQAARSPFVSATSAFQPQPPPLAEPEPDLLWDDTPPPSATPQIPQSTGLKALSQQATGSQQLTFGGPPPIPARNVSGPVAQDPFGSSPFAPAPGAHKDLLSDDDEVERSPPLHDQSAEIGNVRNQLNSTTRSLETAKAERAKLEQAASNQTAELSSMQGQLAVVKASYDHETNLLSSLRERFATQAADIQKTREELICAESDLSAVRVEKAELEGNILRDKEEVRGLNRKMAETTKETETIKAEVEKAKKEAKQQKGLLAIARKQLGAKEAERAKAEKEREEAETEAAAASKEREEAEAALERAAAAALPVSPPEPQRQDSVTFAAAHALPTSPGGSSPSTSLSGLPKSSNPFERRMMSSDSTTPRSQSPFLPFANAPVPTPPVALANGAAAPLATDAQEDDPFGFNQLAQPVDQPIAESATETLPPKSPVPPVAELSNLSAEAPKAPPALLADAVSPTAESELFSTPPTTAATLPPHSAPATRFTVDEINTKFPAVGSIPGSYPFSASTVGQRESTDLSHDLKELDIPESDSDSDDEDEVPLAELAKEKRASTGLSPKPKAAEPNGSVTPKSNAQASFDDVFGVPTVAPAAGGAAVATTDALGASPPAAKPSTGDPFGFESSPAPAPAPAPAFPPPVAGVDAFDAALGKIATPPSTQPQFTFDSAFDDNFDFAAATESKSTFPPVPKPANGDAKAAAAPAQSSFDDVFGTKSAPATAPTQNGATKEAAPATSFDDVFGTASDTTAPSSQATSAFTMVPTDLSKSTTSTNNGAAAAANAFDDTFANFSTTPSLNLDSSFTSVSTPPKSAVASSGTPASPTQASKSQTFPAVSTPGSPVLARATSPTSVASPPRPKSPPPRTASPKPRVSTSSSHNQTLEKPKEPPHRHSKLSIRLPFGKKKKQEAPPPPPPAQFLTPPAEEPSRSVTPGGNEDAEPVKQLCGMGFSRTDAITALERNGYDVQRALNSLLGAA
ncbi:hypothetical protein HGRIS_013418 [Hohenbuehelia grisea]|uniref:Uncharacterized protein n=1 Tax=Hohenbuehelia grisea TaxID=104357 RepID=A0ABR3IVC5_9AGAR